MGAPKGKDLRGRDLSGRDMQGASLRGADLRGTCFDGTDLRGADLRGVRTGMTKPYGAMLVLLALAISVLVGLIAGWAGAFGQRLLASGAPHMRVAFIVVAAELLIFVGAALWRGGRAAFLYVLGITVATALVAAIVAIALGAGNGSVAVLVALAALLIALVTATGVLARALAAVVATPFLIVVALTGALAARRAGGGLLVTLLVIASVLIARRIAAGRSGYPAMTSWTVHLTAAGGTHFRHADLRDACFDGADLRASDFRGARLEGSSFQEAHGLDLCAFDRSAPRSSPHPS